MSKTSQQDGGSSIPTEQDFDPFGGDLDAQCAWRNFGGLSIAEALEKFREHPICYQEDFMFMGGRAFLFYFTVLDRYIREFGLTEHDDDSQAAIIGLGIAAQFSWPTAHLLVPLQGAVSSLADYVCSHPDSLAADPDEQRRIVRDWQQVYSALRQSTPHEPATA